MKQFKPGFVSALIYLGISLIAAWIFLLVTIIGDYTWVARAGGAAWIFLLSTIILMPIVIPAIRKRFGGRGSNERGTFMWPFSKKEKKASSKDTIPAQSTGTVKDPVCGMMVDPKSAPAKSEYKDKTYYFCAPGCKVSFDKDPEKYLDKTNL